MYLRGRANQDPGIGHPSNCVGRCSVDAGVRLRPTDDTGQLSASDTVVNGRTDFIKCTVVMSM